LSYTPAGGNVNVKNVFSRVKPERVLYGTADGATFELIKIRAADAKEVGVGNPAEETCCHPNAVNVTNL